MCLSTSSQYGSSAKSPYAGCRCHVTFCPVCTSSATTALVSSDFFWYVTQTSRSLHGCTYLIWSPGLNATGGNACFSPSSRYIPSCALPADASLVNPPISSPLKTVQSLSSTGTLPDAVCLPLPSSTTAVPSSSFSSTTRLGLTPSDSMKPLSFGGRFFPSGFQVSSGLTRWSAMITSLGAGWVHATCPVRRLSRWLCIGRSVEVTTSPPRNATSLRLDQSSLRTSWPSVVCSTTRMPLPPSLADC